MPAPDDEARLGGRLALKERSELSATQKALWDHMAATLGAWSATVGFQSQAPSGRFIGPFNPMLASPEVASAFLELQIAEAKHTSLSERVRQVIILSVGGAWRSDYALYAHSAAARAAGFSGATISALAEGRLAPDLREEEEVARCFTAAIVRARAVDPKIYAAAAHSLGERGLVDLLVLVGCYQLVCGVLNAFRIPAPAGEKD